MSFYDASGSQWTVLNDGTVLNLETGETAPSMSAAMSGQVEVNPYWDYLAEDLSGFVDSGSTSPYWDDWLSDIMEPEPADSGLPYMDDYWWQDLTEQQTPTEVASSDYDYYNFDLME